MPFKLKIFIDKLNMKIFFIKDRFRGTDFVFFLLLPENNGLDPKKSEEMHSFKYTIFKKGLRNFTNI